MKKSKDNEFTFDIQDIIGIITESDKHDWVKALARISYNDNPAKIDIRNINLKLNRISGGITLTDEEVDKLTDLLLENDFGSMDEIQKALTRKTNRFTISKEALNCFDDDVKIVVKFKGEIE